MIHTCLSPLIDQREVSHVILAQGAEAVLARPGDDRSRDSIIELHL